MWSAQNALFSPLPAQFSFYLLFMELCILSNELNACETTALLNPSKFASCATNEVGTP